MTQFDADMNFQIENIDESINTLIVGTSHIELDEISQVNIAEYQVIDQLYNIWELMDTLKQTSRFIYSFYYLNEDKSFIGRNILQLETLP